MSNWWAKALNVMRHATGWSWGGGSAPLGRTRYDYARDVGMGLDASVVMAPLQWLQRTLPTAPLVVETRDELGKRIAGHPVTALLSRPNTAYSGEHLLAATVFSLCLAGNAYWVKIRNGGGRVTDVWYAPHWLLEPKWPFDGSAFVSHYDYRPGGEVIRLDPADVVHFRHGIDPRNLRLGLAPLASALREIWTDMEAATFIASVLRNSGIPGLVISPDGPVAASPDDVATIKRYLSDQFTGERRGEPLVFSAKTKIDRVGWSPSELDLSAASDRAEERVCALLGVPPVVVGLHAGSTQTAVGATMREQVRLAWQSGVIPLQSLIASEIERSLLPDLDRRPERLRVYFDTSGVEAMSEDTDKIAALAERLTRAGMITLAEARQMIGMESDATHAIYLRPFGMIEVPGATGRAPVMDLPLLASAAPPALKLAFKHGHHHTPFEERMAAEAPHGDPTPEMERFILALEALRRRGTASWGKTLTAFFTEMGEAAGDAAGPILEELLPPPPPKGRRGKTKDYELLDTMITERVLEAMRLPDHLALFAGHYEQHYLAVAQSVPKAAASAGIAVLATDIPDRVARAVIATGGRRAGLVDIEAQARATLLRAVAQARAEGMGAPAVARAIRDQVPAGPWTSPAIRATVIARTETKYAQNYSVFEHGRANGVEQFMVFDARLGDTDEVCMMLDGAIVNGPEAEQLIMDEHPNGTRSISPYFGD